MPPPLSVRSGRAYFYAETIKPEDCPNCGGESWTEIGVSIRQTVRLVEQPIALNCTRNLV
jgi:hypothetical protein